MRVPVTLMVLTLLVLLAAGVVVRASEVKDIDNVSVRQRLAQGIIRWKTKGSVVVWNECGKRYKQEEVKEVAYAWTDSLIESIDKHENLNGWRLNVWGVAGTAANESSFDRCAIGKHTRFWAYDKGLLKPRKRTWISHSREDILRLVRTKEWKKEWNWVDAGGLQVLWKRVWKGPLEDMLTLNPGLDIGVKEMYRRSMHFYKNNTIPELAKRSWRLWPGKGLKHPRSDKYDAKITRLARKLGATSEEI